MTVIPFTVLGTSSVRDTLHINKIFRPVSSLGISLRARFRLIHHNLKRGIIHPILNFIKHRFSSVLIKSRSDIPDTWYNSHLRIWYDSHITGLDDMWLHLHLHMARLQRNKYHVMAVTRFGESYTDVQYLSMIKETCHISHDNRKLLIDLAITEALEDTIDREWLNNSVMRITHNMMKLYGIDEKERNKVPLPGKFPVYASYTGFYPEYFNKNKDMRRWS